ncbi:MAG: hypothetical protein AAF581_06915 [Planctomycetota bacterium]
MSRFFGASFFVLGVVLGLTLWWGFAAAPEPQQNSTATVPVGPDGVLTDPAPAAPAAVDAVMGQVLGSPESTPAPTTAGLADTGLADTGLADTGLADTGLADTGLADTGLADTGAVAALVSLPSFQRGARTVAGRVASGDGDPIEGVRILAAPTITSSRAVPSTFANDVVSGMAAVYHYRRALAVETESDAEGRFVLEGLRDDIDYDVAAEASGWVFLAEWPLTPDEETHDVWGNRARLVQVELVGDQAGSIQSGFVRTSVWDGWPHLGSWHDWTPAHPMVAIPERFRFLKFSASQWESDLVELPNEATAEVAIVQLELRQRAQIVGKLLVTDTHEQDITVVCQRLESGKPIEDQEEWTRATAPVYKFRFDNLIPGEYRLLASSAGGDVAAECSVADGTTHVEMELPPSEPVHLIVAVSVGGEPEVRDCEFVLFEDFDELSYGEAESLGGGVSRVRFDGAADVEKARLDVWSPWLGKKSLDIDGLHGQRLEIEFGEPAVAIVEIPSTVPAALRNRLRLKFETGEDGSSLRVADRRQVVFPGLSAGEQILSVYLGAASESFSFDHEEQLSTKTVTLRPGDNRVPLPPLLPLYQLTLRFAPKHVGQHCSVSGESYESGRVAADGLLTFPWLLPGEYTVSLHGAVLGQSQRMTVTLDQDLWVDFAPKADVIGITVAIEDAQGGLAAAGLMHGDLIVSVNDLVVDDRWYHFVGYLTSNFSVPLALIVQREGQQIELAYTGVADDMEAGGTLTLTNGESP